MIFLSIFLGFSVYGPEFNRVWCIDPVYGPRNPRKKSVSDTDFSDSPKAGWLRENRCDAGIALAGSCQCRLANKFVGKYRAVSDRGQQWIRGK